MNNSSRLPLAIISIVISGLAFGLVGYWFGSNVSTTQTAATASPVVSSSPVATASVLPITSTTDPTVGWKTYTDATYGFFSVKYPNNWTISHDITPYATCPNTANTVPPVGITLTNPDVFKTAQGGAWEDMNESFRINIYNSVNDASCGYTSNYNELLKRNIFVDKATQITVGGVNAIKGNFIAGNGGLSAVYLQKDNKVYEFIPYKETGNMIGSSVETTSNQILSTVKFAK